MRKCRKCKIKEVPTKSRKYCDDCKLKPQICECGTEFTSKNHKFCKLCRNSKGNIGNCEVCDKTRHIYYNTGLCNTCYRFTHKYNINKDQLKEFRKIDKCQLCGIDISHNIGNGKGTAVIDHCHKTGKVRGILCLNCNLIEGFIRDEDHLKSIYINYKKWIS